MRLNLATSLKNRSASVANDAKLLNAFVEVKAEVRRVVKRPALDSSYEVTAGGAQALFNFDPVAGSETLVSIVGDVLNNLPNSAPKSAAYFVQPAASTGPNTAISPAIVVRMLGKDGLVAKGFTGSIVLSIANNPVGGILSGTLAVAAVAGVATFSNVKIDKIGNGYTLKATATI